jgi:hypothetical protein
LQLNGVFLFRRASHTYRGKSYSYYSPNSALNIDSVVKSLKTPFAVFPAKAGIQSFQIILDACFPEIGVFTDLSILPRYKNISKDYSRPPHLLPFVLIQPPTKNNRFYNLDTIKENSRQDLQDYIDRKACGH